MLFLLGHYDNYNVAIAFLTVLFFACSSYYSYISYIQLKDLYLD
jgi:hypothetical protein